jgi:hypothetical protein
MKVSLADRARNHIIKRIGFSWLYFFFGPIYLLFRLRPEAILFGLAYYYFLPLPGMEAITNLIASWGWNPLVSDFFIKFFLYFRSPFSSPRVYFGIALIVFFHIFYSCVCDNFLLGLKMKKKHLSPVTEEDARNLIACHAVKPDVLLAKEVSEKEHLFEQAERVWEDKNINYTSMLSRNEIDLAKQEAGSDQKEEEEKKRHLDNATLLRKGIISKEEYEILEKRSGK